MHLFNNTFDDIREIKGYSKGEILKLKDTISRLKTDNNALEEFIESNFQFKIIEFYSDYLSKIKEFIENYLILDSEESYYTNLKTEIHNELKLISSNLANLSSNGRNIKRSIKNNKHLNDFLIHIKSLINEIDVIISILKRHIIKIEKIYENDVYLWVESNKIKNLNFKLNKFPEYLMNWEDFKEITVFIKSLVEAKAKKKIKPHSDMLLSFHFDELQQYFLDKQDGRIDVYDDLIYLMYKNNIFEEYKGEEFINILERKDVIKNLKTKFRPIIISVIEDKLGDIFNELIELDEKYDLDSQKGKFNVKSFLEEKFSELFPNLIDLYFKGLDKKFQNLINKVDEKNIEEFVKIVNSYYEKTDSLSSKIDEIDSRVLKYDQFLKPYESITSSLKKTISGLTMEIYRRKEEYTSYLNTIKDEGLRVDVRAFIDEKITQVNKLVSSYEDETSKIIKEELPQLKEIRELLAEYKAKIEKIKEDVYSKLDTYKESNIDMYQVIKYWENNFNRKKQQLTFLLTLVINKIFKSFKELIDEESILFAEITEITKQTENFEGLPLNFALSAFLAERLSEKELKERISEINAKVNQLTTSLGLYEVERSKLEEILTNKVKIREGVSVSNVQCTVCHKYINFVNDKLITCPFCGSTYHYLCVADWLSRYNSCPMCQNHFLEPYSGLFETDE